jgi:hypothetical protein
MGYGLKYVAPDNAVRFDSLTAPDIGRRLLTPDMRMSRSFNPQRSCWRGGRWYASRRTSASSTEVT